MKAFQLRKSGITLPILVMNPEQSAYDEIIDFNLEPGLLLPGVLDSFIHHLILRQIENFSIHVKLDTGMNRLGFVEDQIPQLLDTLQTQPEVYVNLFTHTFLLQMTEAKTNSHQLK
ncbi:MAG: alanine racemase [Crocinitomicaceae bacterium]|nr:alanine racemase [Crocinitomicaceae bacterium]